METHPAINTTDVDKEIEMKEASLIAALLILILLTNIVHLIRIDSRDKYMRKNHNVQWVNDKYQKITYTELGEEK